jgi:phenylalanyl-tRNA synthetase beta subunit
MLALVTKGVDYLILKGIVEALLAEMGAKDLQFEISSHDRGILSVEIPFGTLVSKATKLHEYVSLVKYNSIKEDLTIKIDKDSSFEKIVDSIKKTDSRIVSVEFSGIYEDKLTLSLEFLDREKQITSEDVAPIREKILKIAK